MLQRRLVVSFLSGAAVVLLALAGGCAPAAPAAQTTPLIDQMRQPWEPAAPVFTRDFMVCGPFDEPTPLAPSPSRPLGQPPVLRPAEFVDYLASAGGEPNARPEKGQTLTTPDGRQFTWTPFTAKANLVNLADALPAAKDRACVAYAYATVHRDSPARAFLAIWGRGFLTVYLNGTAVMSPADRDALLDGAYVPLALQKGDNALLIRVAGVTPHWPFSLRVVDETDLPVDDPALLRAAIAPDGDPSALAVRVDNYNQQPPPTLTVEVLGAAGKPVARQDVPRGRTHRFDASAWPQGPYEVRALASAPDGKPIALYLTWYKGRWQDQAAQVLSETARLPAGSADPTVLKKLLVREVLLACLGSRDPADASPSPNDLARVISALLEYREADLPGKALAATGSFYRLAWRDEVDDSPQYARLHLPLGYDPARKYPLVVHLHGRSAENLPYAVKDQGDRHERLAEQCDVIWLAPFGRGNTGYRGIGEADVLRAVAEARRHFSIDADRIYLAGRSMGGSGAWFLGTRHTDLFAAIAPIYGGGDYHAYATARQVAAWPPLRLAAEEQDSSFAQAECLLDTPVFVHVGDKDSPDLVASLRYVVRMLQRWGYDVRYREHPGKGHGGFTAEDDIVPWFLRYSLQRAPRHVRLRSADLSGANAHWVHAERMENPFDFMLVDAYVGRGNAVRVNSRNVLQLRLNPPSELLDSTQTVRVTWNSRQVFDGALPPDGQITLRAEGYAPGRFVKKPMRAMPFAIVVGTTSPDERMRRLCRLRAEQGRDAWIVWQHVPPRFFTDTEMTDQQIRDYSLFLFGGPAENAVTARLAKDIPLEIAPGRITIDGHPFEVPNAAVRLVYAHPLNDDRIVTVIAGNSADGMFHVNRLREDADFVIADGRIGSDDDYLAHTVVWGRFDHNWRRNDDYLLEGSPARRAAAPVHKVPRRVSAATPDPRLPLADLLESASVGSFTVMTHDRNWHGKPITLAGRTFAGGLAVEPWREPCKAAWDLTGGDWKRLRATIGIEPNTQAVASEPDLADQTRITFTVRGDGKTLYTSPALTLDSKPVDINVDVTGVTRLELEVANDRLRPSAAASADWADIRLEK